jgi:hypothetical protein
LIFYRHFAAIKPPSLERASLCATKNQLHFDIGLVSSNRLHFAINNELGNLAAADRKRRKRR